MEQQKKSYYNCSVDGCLNSTLNSDLSFFKLPVISEWRTEWLRLIHREDLIDSNTSSSYRARVCEAHFSPNSIRINSSRKLLKRNSIPQLLLPLPNGFENKGVQAVIETADANIQCDYDFQMNAQVQIPLHLSNDMPRKTIFLSEVRTCHKRLKIINNAQSEANTFFKLCDKFLTPALARVVKQQTKIKAYGHRNSNIVKRNTKKSCSFRTMAPLKVLIVNKTYPAVGLEILRKNGIKTTVLPHLDYFPESLPDIKKSIVNGYDGLIWNTKHKLNSEILSLAGPQLKAISTMSSGLDHVDLAEVKKRGLPLGNTLQVLDDTVADITVGLLISAARRFKEGLEEVASGDWKYGVQWNLGQDIAGSTVGIVGFGGIGQAVARRLRGFDVARFLYSGRSDKSEAKVLNAERVPIDELLRVSDFVIICCPLTAETKNLINADSLRTMKKTAVLVNIARGGVVDTEALYEALKENRIFAAGLDVIDPEPISKDHPIVSLPNCFLLPHVGSATVGCRNKMATIAANNVIAGLQGKPMQCPVSL